MPDYAPRHFAIVPAAGVGRRMGGDRPKQYLPLLGKPLIRHTLEVLCAQAEIDKVFVVLSVDDPEWGEYDWSDLGGKLVSLFCGGPERAASVLGGLRALAGEAAAHDWVLVHDAARPCIAPWDITRLIRELAEHEVGGLLGVPVADTLKRADEHGRVIETVSRAGLWQAQTPQMFRYAMIRRALEEAGSAVTDEASAIEAAGLHPQLVEGETSNLKVTYPHDLHIAAHILRSRTAEER